MSRPRRPSIAIVTGRPGSGKSTLAAALAAEMRCPLVSRDRLKEGCLRTRGLDQSPDRDLALRVCDTFFSEIELLVRNGISLVAEAAFQHKVWAPRIEPLLDIAEVKIIVCTVAPELTKRRRLERERLDPMWVQYHPTPEGWDVDPEPYEPPRLDVPTLQIDTSGDVTELIGPLLELLR